MSAVLAVLGSTALLIAPVAVFGLWLAWRGAGGRSARPAPNAVQEPAQEPAAPR